MEVDGNEYHWMVLSLLSFLQYHYWEQMDSLVEHWHLQMVLVPRWYFLMVDLLPVSHHSGVLGQFCYITLLIAPAESQSKSRPEAD